MNQIILNEICDLQNGFAFSSEDYIESSETLNCRMSNIRPGGIFDIEYSAKFLPNSYADKYSNYLLKDGDIVIAMTDMANDPKILGLPTIVDTKGYNVLLNQRVGKLIIQQRDKVYAPYLQYALNRKVVRDYYKRFAGGGLQLNVGKKEILSLKIPFPPLQEQKRIASILDKADALHKKNKQLLDSYDELLQATFLDMVGDPVANPKKWKQLAGEGYCKKITVGVVVRPASYYVEKGVIALRSLNIKPNEIDLNNLVYFSKEAHQKELSKSILKTDDIVFVRTGVTGTAAVIPKELNGCNCIDLIITRVDTKIIHPKYLVFFYNSERGKNLVSSKEVGGIQKHFNIGAIKKLKIPIPPINLQNQFAQIVENIEAQKTILRQSIQESEDLFNGLVQKAFKGELSEQ